ncbi:MAG: hypothetical protein NZL87_04925, partial [Thermomicrobium sp.]|nr:hypothetical protein [Thermomicrobium sp.]
GWLATRVQRAAIGAVHHGNAAYHAAWFCGFEKPGKRSVTPFDRQQNLAFWVQALAYPVTRSLVLFFAPDWLTQHARSTVLLTGATTVALALTVHALGRQQRLALAACGFALLAFLPALLFLPFRGYVEDGPRLLYPAAPAIATFWGLLPRAGWRWRRGRWGGVTLGTLVVATTLVHSIGFVERRTELARLASRAQEQVVEAARSNPGWPLVVVDAPAWLALHRYEYPLGHFGMNAQPEYLGFDALLEARLGWRQPVESLAVTRSFDYGRYTVGPHGHPSTQASLASYRLSGWVLVPVDLARATAGGTDRVPGMPHGRRSVIGSMGENRSRTGPNT